MTRKDFELIAATIAKAAELDNLAVPAQGGRELTAIGHYSLAVRFANALAATNPKFDHARFLKACGIK